VFVGYGMGFGSRTISPLRAKGVATVLPPPPGSPKVRKNLSADALYALLGAGFATIPDHRDADATIPLSDALLSALAMFSLKDPSLLAFDQPPTVAEPPAQPVAPAIPVIRKSMGAKTGINLLGDLENWAYPDNQRITQAALTINDLSVKELRDLCTRLPAKIRAELQITLPPEGDQPR
jgi:hypothetical protein